jgi:hypothetical protein
MTQSAGGFTVVESEPTMADRKGKKTGSRGTASGRPVFSVRFTDGLATRNRLPLDHVIRVLNEIKGMMEEVGRRVQRERGASEPDGDFGLELAAGFRRGSVRADILITRNVDVGAVVAQQILETVSRLGRQPLAKNKRKPVQQTPSDLPTRGFDPRVVTRLNNIGKVQEIDKTKMELSLRTNGGRPNRAVFDKRSVQVVAELREPNFSVSGLTVYGKLRQLRDKYDDDEESAKAFFGELTADDGTVWRVEFKPRDVDRAAALFRKQVYVNGNATYYQALHPRIDALEFGPDEERDYETAFDELFGSSPELGRTDIHALLKELREA